MANGVLSSYFEKEKAKGTKAGGGLPEYSTAMGMDAGTAPAPAAGPTGPTPPTGSTRGGSGFVNFGSYFGANAPAIERESQKAAAGASSDQLGAMRGQGGNVGEGTQASTFNQMLMGGTQRREAEQETARRLPFQMLKDRFTQGVTDPFRAQKATTARELQTAENARTQQETQQREAALLQSAKEAAWENSPPWSKVFASKDSYWNSLSEEQKNQFLGAQ